MRLRGGVEVQHNACVRGLGELGRRWVSWGGGGRAGEGLDKLGRGLDELGRGLVGGVVCGGGGSCLESVTIRACAFSVGFDMYVRQNWTGDQSGRVGWGGGEVVGLGG